MSYLVDSDIVIDWLRGNPTVTQQLDQLEAAGLAISLITFGEIYEGVYFGREPIQTERVFRLFLRGVDVLSVNRSIMKRFARLRGELRQIGRTLPDPDLLIATTAIYHDLTLVTGNRRHFQRIPGLRLHLLHQ